MSYSSRPGGLRLVRSFAEASNRQEAKTPMSMGLGVNLGYPALLRRVALAKYVIARLGCRVALLSVLATLGACQDQDDSADQPDAVGADAAAGSAGSTQEGGSAQDTGLVPDSGPEAATVGETGAGGSQGADAGSAGNSSGGSAQGGAAGAAGAGGGATGGNGGSAPSDSCDGTSVRHITPTGAGDKSGEAESSAGTMGQLNAFIEAVGPGGQVCIHAGDYDVGWTVTKGGTTSAPVTVKGVGGRPVFKSDFEASTKAKSGPIAFKIQASNLVFHNLEFEHVGEPFKFPNDSDVSNITLSTFKATNVASGVEIERYGSQVVKDLKVFQAMILQFSRAGILVAGAAQGVSIKDCYIDMQPNKIGGQGSDYPVGIPLYDTAKDITIEGTTVLNVVGKKDGYSQGDGMDCETTVKDVVVSTSFFQGSQDGCIDTKARNMIIKDTVAVGCKRNFRLWQMDGVYPEGPRCEGCISYEPKDAHYFAYGNKAFTKNAQVYSGNGAMLVVLDNNGKLEVQGLNGTLASPSKLNVSTVTDNQLEYGKDFQIPDPPNPTPFTP